MRSRVSIPLVAAAAVTSIAAAVAWAASPTVPQAQAQATVTVTVLFMCEGERSVDPWEVHVRSGRDVDWVLDPKSDATDFRIRRKRATGAWPFEGTEPTAGRRGARARAKGRANTPKGRYSYDIEASCPAPDGKMQWKRIDPDIIVD